MLRRATYFGTHSSIDPGWCYRNLDSSEFQPALTGLERLPSPTKVLNAIEKIGTTLLPSRVTNRHGIAHVHPAWGFTTTTSLFRASQVGLSSHMTIGALKVPNDDHLVVSCTLNDIPTQALIDCGAKGSFCDTAFARAHELTLALLPVPQQITVINGRTILSGAVTHTASGIFIIFGHQEGMFFHVPVLGG